METIEAAGIQCHQCDCQSMYTGPLDVGPETKCEDCDHPLVGNHWITAHAAFFDPSGMAQAGFEIAPQFREQVGMSEEELRHRLQALVDKMARFIAERHQYLFGGAGLVRLPGQPSKRIEPMPHELQRGYRELYPHLKQQSYSSPVLDEFNDFLLDEEAAFRELSKVLKKMAGGAAL